MMTTLRILMLAAFALTAQAQVTTNVFRLTPLTRLAWDGLEKVARYDVTLALGTNVWRASTTNTTLAFTTISTNLPNGLYEISVEAVDAFGTKSLPATISSTLVRAPRMVVRLRIELDGVEVEQ